jgi:tripartite-type tricarboxylate transporter receptor subunit TctC
MVNPSLYAQPPFDALKDFAPVTRAAVTPNILVVVHPSIETKNMKDPDRVDESEPRQQLRTRRARPGNRRGGEAGK